MEASLYGAANGQWLGTEPTADVPGNGARKGWDAADRGTKGPEKPCKVTTGGNLKKKEDIPPHSPKWG